MNRDVLKLVQDQRDEALAKLDDKERELEVVEGSLGRFAHENSRLRISDRKQYERVRRLENAIRKHAERRCGCRTDRQCMLALGKLVPTKPRPPYKKRTPAKKVKSSK